jgi:hypothetical protein
MQDPTSASDVDVDKILVTELKPEKLSNGTNNIERYLKKSENGAKKMKAAFDCCQLTFCSRYSY